MKINFLPINTYRPINFSSSIQSSVQMNTPERDTVSLSGGVQDNLGLNDKHYGLSGFDVYCLKKLPDYLTNNIYTVNRNVQVYNSQQYGGRNEDTVKQRRTILNDWRSYLNQHEKMYSPAVRLFVLYSITEGLKDDNNKLPPEFNRRAFENTIDSLKDKFHNKTYYNSAFKKAYAVELIAQINETPSFYDYTSDSYDKEWLLMKDGQTSLRDANIQKLMKYFPETCDTREKAESFLNEGSIRIYFEADKPQIAMITKNRDILDLNNRLLNKEISPEHGEILKDYFKSREGLKRPGYKPKPRKNTSGSDDTKAVELNKVSYLSNPFNTKKNGWVNATPRKNSANAKAEMAEELKSIFSDKGNALDTALNLMEKGKLYIYREEHGPNVILRKEKGFIKEVYEIVPEQGSKSGLNAVPITFRYVDKVESFIKANHYGANSIAHALFEAKQERKNIEQIKKNLSTAIKKNNVKVILEYFKIPVTVINAPGGKKLYSCQGYHTPSGGKTFADYGIDENKLFENIVELTGKSSFAGSDVTNLGNLKVINGDVEISDSKLSKKDFSKISVNGRIIKH